MASLYFLGKYEVMLAIVVVLSNNIWCSVSILCSDNDCVACFSLTSRWCSFIRRLTILSVAPMYTYLQEQVFCILLRSWVEVWSLGFLKICPIFLDSLKILCLFNILPIRSVVPLTYGRMGRILSSGYVSKIVVLFAYLLIILVVFFCRVRFSIRLVLGWVL